MGLAEGAAAVALGELIYAFCLTVEPRGNRKSGPKADGDLADRAVPGEGVEQATKIVLSERMAGEIAAIMERRGHCTPEDLRAEGFSAKEIKLCWRLAYALARVRRNWMDA
jgi:hypothetical protein